MSNRWKVKIKSSAKGDLKKVLRSPLRQSFEEIKNYYVMLKITGHNFSQFS